MDIRKEFGTDENLEEEGVEVELGDGAFITVCRFGNEKFNRLYRKKTRRFQHLVKRGREIPEKDQDRIMIELYNESVIKSWRGIELDGQPFPYSEDNCLRLLREFKDFRNTITRISTDPKTFQGDSFITEDEEDEENRKNS